MAIATLVAALFIVLSLWYGWSNGLPRILCEIAGGILGLAVGWLFGPTLAPAFRTWMQAPDIILAIVAGLVIALGVFIIVKVCSMVFLKSTKHHGGFLKLLFGATGAGLCVIAALILVALGILGVREVGCLLGGAARKGGIAGKITSLSDALEGSLLGPILTRIHPLTGSLCDTVKKIEKVFRDEKRVDRFFELPESKTLFSDPKLMIIVEDDELRGRLREKRLVEVLSDRNVIAALNDPAIWKKITAFDWDFALAHALGTEPAPNNTP